MTAPDPREEILLYLTDLRGFAMSLTRNRAFADDIMQETILKAWSNIDRFEPGTNMKAWLFTILRNTYFTEHRRQKREYFEAMPGNGVEPTVRPDHDGHLALRDFKACFETLPDEQREALILVGAQGFSYKEAAATAGVAVGTIKSRVARARARLVQMLGLEDGWHGLE